MAAGAAAAAAAIANAIKASGVLIRLEPEEFQKVLHRNQKPLIVHAFGGLFSTKYEYLTNYRGLAFYTKSKVPLQLPIDAELVLAKHISIPS